MIGLRRAPHRPGTRPQRLVLLALAIGVLGLLLAPIGLIPVPTARGASTDLTVVTVASYTVEPSQRRVRVVVDATLANHRADTQVKRYFFDHAFLNVQPGAASPTVVKGPSGGAVRISSKSANATTLRLDFGQLFGGHTASLRFAFDLKDTGTTAGRLVRVSTSLVTFPVWAYASDGASGSRVTVRFPKGYDVNVEAGSFAAQTQASDGSTVLATNALANPLAFFAYVSGQQAPTYRATNLSVRAGDETIPLTMQAWKDDRAWAGRVGPLLTGALPLLRADIGLAWPHDGPVIVQESGSRSAAGIAGVYDARSSTIQLAYWASAVTVVNEAAHGWFNGALLADRWSVEGFTGYYAQRALAALKIKAAPPKLTADPQAAAFPLNDWPATPAPESAAESYGYAASYALATLIAKQAGPDALARVWSDAATRIGAYQPPSGPGSTPERVDGAPDWRGLLDLLETETGSDFTTLWRTWVVRPGESGLLDQRASARAAYRDVLEAANGWALPRVIRDALRAWQFGTATSLTSHARTALAERARLEAKVSAAGLALPPSMRRLFEAGDFGGAVAEAQQEEAAIAAIETAGEGRAQGVRDTLTTVGMMGEDPDRDLTTATAAFAAGDSAAAISAAQAASHLWADARGEGQRRVLMAAAVAVALGVLVVSLASRLRRVRRPRPESSALVR